MPTNWIITHDINNRKVDSITVVIIVVSLNTYRLPLASQVLNYKFFKRDARFYSRSEIKIVVLNKVVSCGASTFSTATIQLLMFFFVIHFVVNDKSVSTNRVFSVHRYAEWWFVENATSRYPALSRESGNGSGWREHRRHWLEESNEVSLGWLIRRGLERAKTRAVMRFSADSRPHAAGSSGTVRCRRHSDPCISFCSRWAEKKEEKTHHRTTVEWFWRDTKFDRHCVQYPRSLLSDLPLICHLTYVIYSLFIIPGRIFNV